MQVSRRVVISGQNSPGAKAGSSTSISTLMYTLLSPTRAFNFSITPDTPMRSMSRALTISKPQRISFRISPFGRKIAPRMPAWIDEFLIKPSSCAMCRNVPWLTPLQYSPLVSRTQNKIGDILTRSGRSLRLSYISKLSYKRKY